MPERRRSDAAGGSGSARTNDAWKFIVAAQFAVRLALIAFAVAELRGAMLGGDFSAATKGALLAFAASFALGLVAGELARRVVEESGRREFEERLAESSAAGDGSTAVTEPN